MTPATEEAINALRSLTKCTCHEAYSGRGMEDPNCLHHEYAEYVEALAARVVALEEVVKDIEQALEDLTFTPDNDMECAKLEGVSDCIAAVQSARAKLEERG